MRRGFQVAQWYRNSGKNLPANAGDVSLIPGPGRCPEVGNGNPLQFSCLGNAGGVGSIPGQGTKIP